MTRVSSLIQWMRLKTTTKWPTFNSNSNQMWLIKSSLFCRKFISGVLENDITLWAIPKIFLNMQGFNRLHQQGLAENPVNDSGKENNEGSSFKTKTTTALLKTTFFFLSFLTLCSYLAEDSCKLQFLSPDIRTCSSKCPYREKKQEIYTLCIGRTRTRIDNNTTTSSWSCQVLPLWSS